MFLDKAVPLHMISYQDNNAINAMTTWLKRLKTQLWDGEVIRNDPDSALIFIGITTPWPRRFWNDHKGHITKGLWYVFFGVVLYLLTKLIG